MVKQLVKGSYFSASLSPQRRAISCLTASAVFSEPRQWAKVLICCCNCVIGRCSPPFLAKSDLASPFPVVVVGESKSLLAFAYWKCIKTGKGILQGRVRNER